MLIFRIFMWLVTELIPVAMILCGRKMTLRPGTRNASSGYRTQRALASGESWVFAQRLCGRIWIGTGCALAVLAACAMPACGADSVRSAGLYGAAAVGIELVLMLLTGVPVEAALRRKFDKYGSPIRK